MINNFEEETAVLTDEEKRWAGIIASRIKQNIGSDHAVTSQLISSRMLQEHGIKIGGARLRKIIHYIRTHGLVRNLVASSVGYYVETDKDKIIEYVDSLVQRAEAIYAVARSFDTGLSLYFNTQDKNKSL